MEPKNIDLKTMDSTAMPADGEDASPPPEADLTPDSASSTSTIYPGSAMSPFRRGALILSLCLALFLVALDMTILATALPTITRVLHASAAQYAWIGSSYTLSNAASTPLWAKASAIFGRKPMLMLANGFFMTGALIAAIAPSAEVLIAGRTVQGLGGGGIVVLVNISIADLFAMKDRAKYYGMTAGVFAVSSSLGPVLGGIFTDAAGWRWCFYINLPFDAISLILLFFALKLETPKVDLKSGLRSLDWIGCISIVGGTLCFLFGLETGAGRLQPWSSAEVVCPLVFGSLILGFFMVYEAKVAKNPLIPTRIFRSRTNIAAFSVTCLQCFAYIQVDFFLPLYYQAVLSMRPIVSGACMVALVLPTSLIIVATGLVVGKTGNYLYPMYFGAFFMTLGMGLFLDFQDTTDWAKIILFPMMVALGVGPLYQTPMLALQSHVEERDIAPANAALSFLRTLFYSISIVTASVLLQNRLGSSSLSDHSVESEGAGYKKTYMGAFRTVWGFYTVVCGLMFLCTFAVKGKNIRAEKAVIEEEQPDQA